MVKISNNTLSEQTYEAIKDMIFAYELEPGEFLSIEGLSKELGVSQTPIREALIRLSNNGLVEYNPRRKAQISEISSEDIDNAYEVRKILEPYIASNAAANVKKKDVKEIKQEIDAIEELEGEERYEKYHETDIKLNNLLLSTVNNELLLQMFDFIENWNIRIRFFAEATDRDHRDTLIEEGNKEHRAIVQALLDRSPERARQAVLDHLQSAENRTWKAFDKQENE